MAIRKPGLWHGPRKVEVVAVTKRHAKLCADCDELPIERRLVVIDGVGRAAKTKVRCVECGIAWVQAWQQESTRACHYLRTGHGSIREQ